MYFLPIITKYQKETTKIRTAFDNNIVTYKILNKIPFWLEIRKIHNKYIKIFLQACHSKTTEKMLWITEICELNSELRFLIEILDYKSIRFLLPFWNLLRTKPSKLLNIKVSLKFWWTFIGWEMLHTGSKVTSLFIHNSINSYSLINNKKCRDKLLHFNITS